MKHNFKQWGVTAFLVAGMAVPPAASPFISQAVANPVLVNPTAINPAQSSLAKTKPVDASETDKAAILAAYRQADAAYDDFDLEGVWQNRSETFYLLDEDGKRYTADALKEDLSRIFKTIEAMKSTTTIQKIVVQGNKATVASRNSSTASVPTTGTGSVITTVAFRSTDTWLKQSGRWVFAHTQLHSVYSMSPDKLSGNTASGSNASEGNASDGISAGGTSPASTAKAKTPAATAAHIQAARKSIQADYNKMIAAARRRDFQGASGNRTADYILILKDGSYLPREAVDQYFSPSYRAASSIQASYVIEKFELKGDMANVTTRTNSTTTFPARQFGRKMVIKAKNRTLDTWIKHNGQWFIARSQTLAGSATANGKSIPVY